MHQTKINWPDQIKLHDLQSDSLCKTNVFLNWFEKQQEKLCGCVYIFLLGSGLNRTYGIPRVRDLHDICFARNEVALDYLQERRVCFRNEGICAKCGIGAYRPYNRTKRKRGCDTRMQPMDAM